MNLIQKMIEHYSYKQMSNNNLRNECVVYVFQKLQQNKMKLPSLKLNVINIELLCYSALKWRDYFNTLDALSKYIFEYSS